MIKVNNDKKPSKKTSCLVYLRRRRLTGGQDSLKEELRDSKNAL